MKKEITVVDYQPEWAEQFRAFCSVFQKYLEGKELAIEHVGSTSVEGLAAKPILDIDIIVEDDDRKLSIVIGILETLGYRHVGDQGVPGREALKPNTKYAPIDGSDRVWPKHHLYVCREGAVPLQNHLTLRDYLRTHPEKRKAYGMLKKQLAEKFPNDMDAYIDGKTEFIVEILQDNGFTHSTLEAIKGINAKDS